VILFFHLSACVCVLVLSE